MNGTVTPLILFSLQRSGSTLCQRILAAHPEIATASETHLLLPYFYSIRDRGVYAEYGHNITSWAIQDFCQVLPEGVDDYLGEIRELALRLYTKAAQYKARYFLDKAAKYHLIVEEIIRLFPLGKFIFVWRNPLSIIASLMESWERGKWNIYHYEISLYEGLPKLVEASRKYAGQVCVIRYEEMLLNPEYVWRGVFEYLDLSFDPSLLNSFSQVELNGRIGDQWGVKQYQSLSKDPVNKWKDVLANPLRKSWVRRYLRWLGKERLAVMGYDLDQLLKEVDEVPNSLRYLPSDFVRFPLGAIYQVAELRLLKHKIDKIRTRNKLYIHT